MSQREDAAAADADVEQDSGIDFGHMREEAAHLIGDARSVFEEISERIDIEGRVEKNPIGTVLAAAGIGFVLGGGLFRPLVGRLIGTGLRLALVPVIRNQLMALAEPYVAGFTGEGLGASPRGQDGEGEEQGNGHRRTKQRRGPTTKGHGRSREGGEKPEASAE